MCHSRTSWDMLPNPRRLYEFVVNAGSVPSQSQILKDSGSWLFIMCQDKVNKGFAKHLAEGKFSFLVVYCFRVDLTT